jgi:hypothetical protein
VAKGGPGAPANVTLEIVEHYASDLSVTLRWTAPPTSGGPVTGYNIDIHSGTDFQKQQSTQDTQVTVSVPCGGGCESRQVDAAVQAVSGSIAGPQAFAAFRGGLPLDDITCGFAGRPGTTSPFQCTLADTNYTSIAWARNGIGGQASLGSQPKVSFYCSGGVPFSVTVTVSNAAGANIRSTALYQCPV